MTDMPTHPLLSQHFASLGAFIHEWAKEYDGKLPRDWLRLHRQLWSKYTDILKNDDIVREWIHAWANEYRAREHHCYYFILNITQATRGSARTHQDVSRTIAKGHVFYDDLPCATQVWEAKIRQLIDEISSVSMLEVLMQTLIVDNAIVRANHQHPVWSAAMTTLYKCHDTFLHITHPREEMAATCMSEAWKLLELQHSPPMLNALRECGTAPWEAFAILTQASPVVMPMTDIEF